MSVKSLPAVLAFRSSAMITDGLFFNKIDSALEPLNVIRHGIRGTQNVAKIGNEVSQIQTTETARISADASSLFVEYSLRLLPLKNALHSCNADSVLKSDEVRSMFDGFIERSMSSMGVDKIAERYARNIANGRWLWRNRLNAETVQVSVFNKNTLIAEFDALKVPMNRFDNLTEGELKVASFLANGLRGEMGMGLKIRATVTFGIDGSVEVYPSENYLEDKTKGFARSLYKVGRPQKNNHPLDEQVMGQAALRDDKIGNSLRTFDTWYVASQSDARPIPIEPNGANLENDMFYRPYDSELSAFKLFLKLDKLDPASDEGQFCLACLIRGGVYGTSDEKAEKKAKEEADKAAKAEAKLEAEAEAKAEAAAAKAQAEAAAQAANSSGSDAIPDTSQVTTE